MKKRQQSIGRNQTLGIGRKLRWMSGGSLAAAAFLLASAPHAAQAQTQLRTPNRMIENTPQGNGIFIPQADLAQNQPHNRAPHFRVEDIRISSPLNPLPVNDVRISTAVNPLTVADVRISAPIELPRANQPRIRMPDFDPRNVRISAPVEIAVEDIRISTGVSLPDAFQPQAVGPRISATQAIQANIVDVTAVTSYSRSSSADVVTTFSAQNVLTWSPLDTASSDDLINILPSGTLLTFVGPATGYTILNRILPTGTTSSGNPRGIAFSGNVASRLGDDIGPIGGNIWFYSPGGILIGADSTFDVGGLVLTTNDIDTFGGLFGPSGEIRFSGVADSTASVIVGNGATINARNNGSSYVAMVAPRVEQAGTVNVDGSAAYVAAEQADLTINNGLFDISIGVGTTDGNGVVHSGTTTGPSSTPSFDGAGDITDADAQAIYLVAFPKNDALTMLVSGNVGYQPAASAAIVNGNVVLSAGADVAVTGDVTNTNFAIDTAAPGSDSNIQLENAAFGSSVSAFATSGIIASTSSVTDSVIATNSVGAQDLTLKARNQIDINARGGGNIGANGNVTLRAGSDNIGGTININADQVGFTDTIISGLLVTGDLIVDANAAGLDDFATVRDNGGTGIGQDAVGGNININITGGGDLVVGGTAQFSATAQGGKGENQNGSGQGGNINLNISSGTFNVTGATTFDTQVIAAQNMKIAGNGSGLIGSDSVAGNIGLNLSGGSVTTGSMFIGLGAIASPGEASGGAQSNDATGGVFDLTVTGGTHVINELNIDAIADASDGSFDATGTEISGSANAGTANILIDSGSLTVNANLNIDLITYGVTPASLADRASLTVQNGAALTVVGNIDIDTRSFDGVDSVTNTGGSISIVTDNATITAGGLILDTSARPNDQFFFSGSDEGKDFQAGDIDLVAQNGGTFTAGASTFRAIAKGNDLIAGNGTGGNILVHANGGSINFVDTITMNASGIGGVGGTSANPASLGTGQGGAINFRVEGAGGSMAFANLVADSYGSISVGGEGGAPRFEGDGGLGIGGNVTFDLLGGTFTAATITVGSDGSGGGGGDLVTLPASGMAPSPATQTTPEDLTVANIPLAGGISAGDGGDGQGGDVTFNLNGGNATVTNLTISSNGFGGDGADGNINSGTAGGDAGRGIGGNTIFNAQSGTLTVTSTLTVSADGNNQNIAPYGSSGSGGFGYGSDGGNGGAGIGGTATFNLNGSATINADTVIISTSADGGNGGTSSDAFDAFGAAIQAGIAGTGGDATGGDATFNNNAGTLNFTQLSVNSIGTGGNGGDVFGSPFGRADNIAGDGGTGTGGNATININQDDLNNPVYIVNASGVGGDGGDGLDGGRGGAAVGGIAAININNATANPDDPTIIASATGGAGGAGKRDNLTGAPGDSGDGGSANAGTARLQVTGIGGSIDVGFITLEANATGGAGTAGFYQFGGGIDGGNAGSGGSATGGTVEIIARTGATINLGTGSFAMTSTGTGGAGGAGGNSYDSDSGDGGSGGDANGGTARLLAQGATIVGNDISITTAGQAGDGGAGGTYGVFGTNGIGAMGGAGTGGTGVIEIQEGSPGIVTFNDVVINANGTGGAGPIAGSGAGGRVEITDTSIDPAGLISLNSLTANAFDTGVGAATGSASAPLGGFFVTGNSGAMAIVGDLTVNVAGNIEYSFDGDGQMTVGGNATLVSGQNILVDHSNNISAVNSIDVSGTFSATAQSDFISTAGSRINAADTATVRTGQNATVADIAGVGLVDISAMWNTNVTNAAVTGTPTTVTVGAGTLVAGPLMRIQAGHDPIGTPGPTPSASFDPNFDATISGDVTSTGSITINSGGSALFSTGSNAISDNGLTVQTGDDIIIQTGASVVAANNPATTPSAANPFANSNNLLLQAGALTPLSTATLTPIASIVATGDINANNFAVVMTANAIDGLGGTITASSLSADINDAPSNAVIAAIGQSDDNGLLNAQCLQGNVCLGTLNADNLVYVGQSSNVDVIQAIVESGTVSANDILVTTRRDIVMGTTGLATILDAVNQLALQSNEGNIDLASVSATSNSIAINAAGSLLGTANLNSTSDIGITVGADINAASINTGGQLTQVADMGGGNETNYDVPGSIAVGTYVQGTGVRFQVTAGNDIGFDQITLPGQDINLIAGNVGAGDVFLGTTTGASAISLIGDNVGFDSLTSSLSTTIVAGNGDVTGGLIDAGTFIDIDATGGIGFDDLTGDAIGLNAAGLIGGGDLTATNGLALDGGDIAIGNATAASINFASGLNILFDSIGSPNAIALTTANGRIGANTGAGDIDSDGNIDLTAQAIDVGDVTAGGSVTADATATDASFGTVDAANDITLTAVGTSTLAHAISGGDTSITGASVTLNNGTIGGNLILNALAGDVDGNGTVTVGGGIDLDATGAIGFGDLDAQGGPFTVDAGGNINFTSATSGDDMNLNADGSIDFVAALGGNITIDGTTVNFDTATGDMIDIASNGAIGFSQVNATGNVMIDSNFGLITGGIVEAIGAIRIDTNRDASFDTINGGGNITIRMNSNSDLTANAITSGTNVDAILQGGTFVADTVSAAMTGQGGVVIRSDGGIELRNVSGNDISLQASNGLVDVTNNVDVTNLIFASGTAVSLVSQQDMRVEASATNGAISLSAAGNMVIQGAQATGDITVSAIDDVLINSLVNAANGLQITAGGLIDIQAETTGSTIRTVSADMNIGSAGNLGRTDLTSDIRIFTDGTTRLVLGGANDPLGVFYLGNDEFSRIHSGGDLTITAAPTAFGGYDMVVQDLDILVADNVSGRQSGNIGLSNNFNLVSGQSISVVGVVDFSNGNASSGLNFTTGQDLFIDAASGVIQMTDANGNFSGSGTLSVTAPNIYAMTNQALDDVAGLSAADIDSRLANNDGIDLPDGLIRADNVQMNVTNNLLIQNTASGTDFADRRGFNVGSLSISGPSTGNANIVINGIVGGAAGLETIPATDVSIGFDPASTINGCVIVNPASCAPTPTPEPVVPELDHPVQDVIEEEVTPEKYATDPFATNLIMIKENEESSDDPLIDEPVTGAGNDDLWVEGTDCEQDSNGICGIDDAEQELEPAE